MLAGTAATMQRLTVVPPVSGYGFQTLTPADHDGDTAPPAGAPGIFMRHRDDEAHDVSPVAGTDLLEMWEMSVDFATPANTTVTKLPNISITDFNSWMINYTTFFSVPQPGSGTRLDAIREVLMQRLVYRNFGTHETLLGVFATNRDPATSGTSVQQGTRWFELRRTGGTGGAWGLHDEGTFGGDTNAATANFFMGSVAMDRQGDVALGYSKTDVGGSPVFPSIGYTGRLSSDAAGTLGPEQNAVLGAAASTGGGGRWGDYASMSIDPSNDCTFWLTNEYGRGDGNWDTRITSFTFDACLTGFTLSATPSTLNVCTLTRPGPTRRGHRGVGRGLELQRRAGGQRRARGHHLDFCAQRPGTELHQHLYPPGRRRRHDRRLHDRHRRHRRRQPRDRAEHGGRAHPGGGHPRGGHLSSPANSATGQSTQPTLTWTAATDALTYDVDVATDAGFTNVVHAVTGLKGLSYTVPTTLNPTTAYYWRVTSDNTCGTTETAVFSFTTVSLVTRTFASTDVPVAIPEGGGTSGTTTSRLVVDSADGGDITDVNVLNLVGTHTWMGDLDFFLQSPAGTSVQLREQACSSSDNFNINYDDDAAPGNAPCPPTDGGTYQPESPLSAFAGEDSTGTWTLTIVDNLGGDTGQLTSWSLEIRAATRGFTDDPIVPGVIIRAIHFTELRTRIDALLVAGGSSAFPWTDDPLVAGTTEVSWTHLLELQTALDQAYADRGPTHPPYTAGGVGTLIRTIHLMELRQFVVTLEGL